MHAVSRAHYCVFVQTSVGHALQSKEQNLQKNWKTSASLSPRKNQVKELQTDHQKSRLSTWLGHFGWVQAHCSENSPNLTCYIRLRVQHSGNGQSTVPPLRSSFLQWRLLATDIILCTQLYFTLGTEQSKRKPQ